MASKWTSLVGHPMAIVAAIVGVCVEWLLLLAVGALIWLPDIHWILAALLCPGISVSLWKGPQWNGFSSIRDSLKFVVLTPVAGAVTFGFGMIVGQLLHPQMNPIHAAMRTGPMIGTVALIATPLVEIMAIGSLARSMVLAKRRVRPS